MGFLADSDRSEILRLFDQFSDDVQIILFTQHESPLYLPGRDCASCKDTRLLLEEVTALSDKLHLEVHDFEAEDELSQHTLRQ